MERVALSGGWGRALRAGIAVLEMDDLSLASFKDDDDTEIIELFVKGAASGITTQGLDDVWHRIAVADDEYGLTLVFCRDIANQPGNASVDNRLKVEGPGQRLNRLAGPVGIGGINGPDTGLARYFG